MEKKYIELEVVYSGETFVAFKIAKQSHRQDKFGTPDTLITFRAKNGILFTSSAAPSVSDLNISKRLFVRGRDTSMDNSVLEVSKADFLKIEEAVKEYNEFFDVKPKLTVDIFNHPDCPKDARIAVVNRDGSAHWGSYKDTEKLTYGFMGKGPGDWTLIPGVFDDSDYPNTIIRNPKFEPWKPKYGERYWRVNCAFDDQWIDDYIWEDDEYDQKFFEAGLVFESEKKAEAFLKFFQPKFDKLLKESVEAFNEPLEYPDVT